MRILAHREQAELLAGWHRVVAEKAISLSDLWKDYAQFDGGPHPQDSIQQWGNVESYLDMQHDLRPHLDLENYFSHPITIGMAKLHSMAQGKNFVDGSIGKIPDDDLLQGAALGLLKIRRKHEARDRISDSLSVAQLMHNALAHYDASSPQNREDGKSWYPAARDYARWAGNTVGYDPVKSAAVVASLSPQRFWSPKKEPLTYPSSDQIENQGNNVGDAMRFFHHYTQHGKGDPNWLGRGAMGSNYDRVMRVHGAPADQASVEAAMRNPKTGEVPHKITNFYRNLSGDNNAVTIDSWMARGLMGRHGKLTDKASAERILGSPGSYEKMDEAIKRAAAARGILPAEMQATIWTKLNGDNYNDPDRSSINHPRELKYLPQPVIQGPGHHHPDQVLAAAQRLVDSVLRAGSGGPGPVSGYGSSSHEQQPTQPTQPSQPTTSDVSSVWGRDSVSGDSGATGAGGGGSGGSSVWGAGPDKPNAPAGSWGEAVNNSTPSVAGTWGSSSPGGNSSNGSSGGPPSKDLTEALGRAGIDPKMYPLISGFSATEGDNPSGAPTLGFTDSQAGTTLDEHARALSQQIVDRASVAGPFPQNGTPEEQASWMATLVGQNGSPSDWQGNAQPPRSEYVNNIVNSMPETPVVNTPAAPADRKRSVWDT